MGNFKILLTLSVTVLSTLHQAQAGVERALKFQRDQITRLTDFLGPSDDIVERDVAAGFPPPQTISFKNPKAKQFLVEGTKIPNGPSS